jgi:hypothetical protein
MIGRLAKSFANTSLGGANPHREGYEKWRLMLRRLVQTRVAKMLIIVKTIRRIRVTMKSPDPIYDEN